VTATSQHVKLDEYNAPILSEEPNGFQKIFKMTETGIGETKIDFL
jgi:hypothetical protein